MSLMFLPLRLIPVPVQCVVLATVLDLYLTRRDDLAPLLDELDGRVFRIHVTDTDAVFFLGFAGGRPWVHPSHQGDADVAIEATTAGFARLCFAREDPDDLVFQRALRLSGDSEAMLRFKKLLQAADIDWERELRAGFGEYFGARVARAAKGLIALENKAARSSREALRQCLDDADIPDQARFEAWQAGVEEAARSISRLKRRLTRLEKAAGLHGGEARSSRRKPSSGRRGA